MVIQSEKYAKDDPRKLLEDIERLKKQEIDPDDFLDEHPEAMPDRRVWHDIAVMYNRGGQKKFSWKNARHNYYEEIEKAEQNQK